MSDEASPRSHRPSPLRRVAVASVPVLVGLAGAWIALLVAGRVVYPVGPFRVELNARPGPGVTELVLPPFGRIRADTHVAPLELTASLQEVSGQQLTSVLRRKGTDGLALEMEEEGILALESYAKRQILLGSAGALVAGVVAFRRRWRGVVGAGMAGLLALSAVATASWGTYRPEAFLRPTFTGSLALAPQLIGPLREATGRIDDFRAELERLVAGTATAYAALPNAQPATEADVVLLHISDIHLSPLGMDFAQQLAASFGADLVVDTGDVASFGSPLEQGITERIPEFGVPYVAVRGNHDSALTMRQLAAQGAVVLRAETLEVAGLRIHGEPHPLFTPEGDRGVADEIIEKVVRDAGEAVAAHISELDVPPDILAVHDDRMAEASAGLVPLVLSGHFHETAAREVEDSLFLRVGSTGGGGIVPFNGGEGIPLAAQILYLELDPPVRLLGWDTVTLDPLTSALTVSRQLPPERT